MPITRAQVEYSIISRLLGWMAQVGMNTKIHDGTNADLADPIAQMMRAIGYSLADQSNPTDADLLQIPDADIEESLSVTVLFTMRTILGRHSAVDEWAGTDKQSWDNLGKRIQTAIEDVQDDLKKRFGFGFRRKRAAQVAIIVGATWPQLPPPPMSAPPYPPGTQRGPWGPSGTFNP